MHGQYLAQNTNDQKCISGIGTIEVVWSSPVVQSVLRDIFHRRLHPSPRNPAYISSNVGSSNNASSKALARSAVLLEWSTSILVSKKSAYLGAVYRIASGSLYAGSDITLSWFSCVELGDMLMFVQIGGSNPVNPSRNVVRTTQVFPSPINKEARMEDLLYWTAPREQLFPGHCTRRTRLKYSGYLVRRQQRSGRGLEWGRKQRQRE
ncbi:hypothetical protein EV421DRAFT_297158 [Armillaria borealis]|uniref:Uncharacterized protein n=1 Tax=Armillaria borealis TaxID=47425 RepID=A0AA39JQ01_9AGAR|nr:hypothetical protein EV421DRAFT_297158 [Armillaria borealis]